MEDELGRQRQAMRQCSAALFGGASYRLELCGALESGETVTAAGLIDRLPVPPAKASVHVEVQRLLAAGLLVRLAAVPGDRHTYYRVSDTALWQAAREIAAAARDASGRAVFPMEGLVLRSLFPRLVL